MPKRKHFEPGPNKVRQSFTIKPSVLTAAKQKSEQTGLSMSRVVEIALRKWTEGLFDPNK